MSMDVAPVSVIEVLARALLMVRRLLLPVVGVLLLAAALSQGILLAIAGVCFRFAPGGVASGGMAVAANAVSLLPLAVVAVLFAEAIALLATAAAFDRRLGAAGAIGRALRGQRHLLAFGLIIGATCALLLTPLASHLDMLHHARSGLRASPPAGIVLLCGLLVAAAVGFLVKLPFVVPGALVEEMGTWEAVQQSWELTRGHTLSLLGVWLLLAVADWMVVGIVHSLLGLWLGSTPTTDLLGSLAHGMIFAWGVAAATGMYFDVVIRTRGMELPAALADLPFALPADFSGMPTAGAPAAALAAAPAAASAQPLEIVYEVRQVDRPRAPVGPAPTPVPPPAPAPEAAAPLPAPEAAAPLPATEATLPPAAVETPPALEEAAAPPAPEAATSTVEAAPAEAAAADLPTGEPAPSETAAALDVATGQAPAAPQTAPPASVPGGELPALFEVVRRRRRPSRGAKRRMLRRLGMRPPLPPDRPAPVAAVPAGAPPAQPEIILGDEMAAAAALDAVPSVEPEAPPVTSPAALVEALPAAPPAAIPAAERPLPVEAAVVAEAPTPAGPAGEPSFKASETPPLKATGARAASSVIETRTLSVRDCVLEAWWSRDDLPTREEWRAVVGAGEAELRRRS